jgi:hypothetical protein
LPEPVIEPTSVTHYTGATSDRTYLFKHPALRKEKHQMPITQHTLRQRALHLIKRSSIVSLGQDGSQQIDGLFDALRLDSRSVLDWERDVLE